MVAPRPMLPPLASCLRAAGKTYLWERTDNLVKLLLLVVFENTFLLVVEIFDGRSPFPALSPQAGSP